MTIDDAITVVIPAYRSHATLPDCLAALARQSLPASEVIVVDSSPDPEDARAALRPFPCVRLERSPVRLPSPAARNLGVRASHGPRLLFLDPDIALAADALARLSETHARFGGIVAGALACHGGRWLDRGVHLTKFSKWLPGGALRAVDVAPTAIMMCSRQLYDRVGGFTVDQIHADALFAWESGSQGEGVWFEPAAVGFHYHEHTFASFVRERFVRGVTFARMRCAWQGWTRSRVALYAVASVLPVRLARATYLVARQAVRAGRRRDIATTWPLVAAGYASSLAGEAWGLVGVLPGRRPDPRTRGRRGPAGVRGAKPA